MKLRYQLLDAMTVAVELQINLHLIHPFGFGRFAYQIRPWIHRWTPWTLPGSTGGPPWTPLIRLCITVDTINPPFLPQSKEPARNSAISAFRPSIPFNLGKKHGTHPDTHTDVFFCAHESVAAECCTCVPGPLLIE